MRSFKTSVKMAGKTSYVKGKFCCILTLDTTVNKNIEQKICTICQ